MRRPELRHVVLLVFSLVLASAGCGSGSDDPAALSSGAGTSGAGGGGGSDVPDAGPPPPQSMLLYYHANSGKRSIGLATSDDGIHFVRDSASPVLEPGAPGSFDAVGVADPSIIVHEGTYYLYYAGKNGFTELVGLATSSDGRTFTRHPSNPVLIDKTGWASNPSVFVSNGTFFCLYVSGGGNVSLASSPDGVTWTQSAANPILPASLDPGAGQLPPAAGGALVLYFASPAGIGVATSDDAMSWATKGTVLSAGPAGSFDALEVGAPGPAPTPNSIVQDRLFLYYAGAGPFGGNAIGLATSVDGLAFERHGEPLLAPDGSGWEGDDVGEPSIAVVDAGTSGR